MKKDFALPAYDQWETFFSPAVRDLLEAFRQPAIAEDSDDTVHPETVAFPLTILRIVESAVTMRSAGGSLFLLGPGRQNAEFMELMDFAPEAVMPLALAVFAERRRLATSTEFLPWLVRKVNERALGNRRPDKLAAYAIDKGITDENARYQLSAERTRRRKILNVWKREIIAFWVARQMPPVKARLHFARYVRKGWPFS